VIIAHRSLKLRRDDTDLEVVVRISAPYAKDDRWSCAYEIDWPEGTRKFAARCVDAVQAIELALKMIGAEIYTSEISQVENVVMGNAGSRLRLPGAGKFA